MWYLEYEPKKVRNLGLTPSSFIWVRILLSYDRSGNDNNYLKE